MKNFFLRSKKCGKNGKEHYSDFISQAGNFWKTRIVVYSVLFLLWVIYNYNMFVVGPLKTLEEFKNVPNHNIMEDTIRDGIVIGYVGCDLLLIAFLILELSLLHHQNWDSERNKKISKLICISLGIMGVGIWLTYPFITI